MTGWNMPPGCNVRDIPGYDDDSPCAVCCLDVTDCCCPECQVCHETGNPKCYTEHGLKISREQAVGRAKAWVYQTKQQLQDAEMALEYLEMGGEFSEDILDNPDPFA